MLTRRRRAAAPRHISRLHCHSKILALFLLVREFHPPKRGLKCLRPSTALREMMMISPNDDDSTIRRTKCFRPLVKRNLRLPETQNTRQGKLKRKGGEGARSWRGEAKRGPDRGVQRRGVQAVEGCRGKREGETGRKRWWVWLRRKK